MTHLPEIAITGIGGIFPGAPDLASFWRIIRDGISMAREVPEGRWIIPPAEAWAPPPAKPDRVFSTRACFLDPFSAQDYQELKNHGLSMEFIESLDPLYIVTLLAGIRAFESLEGNRPDISRTGIILGSIALPTDASSALCWEIAGRAFEEKLLGKPMEAHFRPVSAINASVTGLPAGLLAKTLGLRGGSYTIDAACASSLYALKYAVDEIREGRADAMLCGGVSRPDCLYTQMGFSQLGALSPDGLCAPFDAKAGGLVIGEGAGIIVLRRLDDALRAGNHIYGIIRGIGLSNDREGNLLAPSSEGQLRAMTEAYRQARWEPSSVDLIECHATGTPVGDAVEFESLRKLRGHRREQCVIGSVKSNIGHLLTGAGAAGLIKVLLALREKKLPPTAHFTQASPSIDIEESPFRVLSSTEEWNREGPRRAAVSAFGFGGINAHVLIEEWKGEKAAERQLEPGTAGPPLAITAAALNLGPWKSTDAFSSHVIDGINTGEPQSGGEDIAGLQRPPGYYIDQLEIGIGRYRIPPRELQEMLPQQIIMLMTAAEALKKGRLGEEEALATGIFIGIDFDFNTTNYHLRWRITALVRDWARAQGIALSDEEIGQWTAQLRDAAGPALNANRTMGALGSVVASRIAREFHCGGPSFTASSGETSGLSALRAASASLRNGEIDCALVGAVDMTGDMRSIITAGQDGKSLCTEGAVALVLRRLDDATRRGDTILGIIRGAGAASGGKTESPGTDEEALHNAMEQALAGSSADPETLEYIELSGSYEMECREAMRLAERGQRENPLALGSLSASLGRMGAAAGLASLLRGVMCLSRSVLPALKHAMPPVAGDDLLYIPGASQYWIRDGEIPVPPRGAVISLSRDGNAFSLIIEAPPDREAGKAWASMTDRSLQSSVDMTALSARGSLFDEALFLVCGADIASLESRIRKLRKMTEGPSSLRELAVRWQKEATAGLVLSAVAGTPAELDSLLELALESLSKDGGKTMRALLLSRQYDPDALHFSPAPLAREGGAAFVFPGSGNHYAGMGRELASSFPAIMKRLDREYGTMRRQILPQVFWNLADLSTYSQQHKTLMTGQVALGTVTSDIVRAFGIEPRASIGYSLGEMAGIFALRAWKDRTLMLSRMAETRLFEDQLAAPFLAARRTWKLSEEKRIDWILGVVNLGEEKIRGALKGRKWVYLLIVNTPGDCVIGGEKEAVQKLVKDLQCTFLPVEGVTTVHCEVVKDVEREYHDFHLFTTSAPEGIRFYSTAWGKSYELTRERAAEAITAQALDTINFPGVITQAWQDGIRIFIEMGPGSSCTRMIDTTLGDRRHMARAVCTQAGRERAALLRLLGHCASEGLPVNLDPLYGKESCACELPEHEASRVLTITRGLPFVMPANPAQSSGNSVMSGISSDETILVSDAMTADFRPAEAPAASMPAVSPADAASSGALPADTFMDSFAHVQRETLKAHEMYLSLTRDITEQMGQLISFQLSLAQKMGSPGEIDALIPALALMDSAPVAGRSAAAFPMIHPCRPVSADVRPADRPFMDREMCMEFAIGSIAKVLGPDFAPIDSHSTRVRLPDEPLMLVDRIMTVEGEPRSLTSGRVVTEHDIHPGAWYLDGGRIPTCIAVEAGQADLFLSGYLGIDFITGGKAVYRLLDAVVTFHRPLPGPGSVIHYDIRIERFFTQGETWLFRFSFESTVDGEPLLSMEKGCAGFFTFRELSEGKGIIHTELDRRPIKGKVPDGWRMPLPMAREAYGDIQIDMLRKGDLAGCLGPLFEGVPLQKPLTIPGGLMRLVDRVQCLEPEGGRFGLGLICAEADIHPDDWFLTCHFSDDNVMPGTLMYECCMHTLRIFLIRMGWVADSSKAVWEPVPGVASGLKCRGQVIDRTKKAAYQISVKELGYRPEPYAIADALMYADGKPVVEITNMSIRLMGTNEHEIENLWKESLRRKAQRAFEDQLRPPLYSNERIMAFAVGRPSEAFGELYRVFDEERIIARLPGPPYKFLDRIVAIEGEPWKMVPGGIIEAQYEVPPHEWYFAECRQPEMPFSVLLEVALQPCGWLAAYVGSALTSDVDLSFRNLGGTAVGYEPVTPATGVLTTKVTLTGVSSSGGMIIQHYSFSMRSAGQVLYEGTTYFGFFSKAALADQIGIRDAQLYVPSPEEISRSSEEPFPEDPPFPAPMLRMVDHIEHYTADGGPCGLGFVKGTMKVSPDSWFFKAHFYQDPVIPGSLGLESFIELMKYCAWKRWGARAFKGRVIHAMASGYRHEWVYRGQVIPRDRLVTVECRITSVDDRHGFMRADGFLSVDGRIIYQMKDFTILLSNNSKAE